MRVINANALPVQLGQPAGVTIKIIVLTHKTANFFKLKIHTSQTVFQKQSAKKFILHFFLLKTSQFLARFVFPLLAQNLSNCLLITLTKFFTTSSLPGNESTFSKSLKEFQLRLWITKMKISQAVSPKKKHTARVCKRCTKQNQACWDASPNLKGNPKLDN